MNDKYRIVERDKFYVQKKSKILKWEFWHYEYKLYDTKPFPVISTFVLSVAGIVLSFFFAKYYIILPTLLFIGLFLLSRYWYPKKEDTLDYAKDYIKEEIKEKERKKSKRVIKKIHYLDIQTERKEKLGNLSA